MSQNTSLLSCTSILSFDEKVPPSPTTSIVRPIQCNKIWPTVSLQNFAEYLYLAEKPKIYMAERTLLLLLEVRMQQEDKKIEALFSKEPMRTAHEKICSPPTNKSLVRAQWWPMLFAGKTTYIQVGVYHFLSSTWKQGICDARRKNQNCYIIYFISPTSNSSNHLKK